MRREEEDRKEVQNLSEDAAHIGKFQLRRHSYQSLHWGRSPHWQGPAEETQLPKSTLRTQPSLTRSSWGDTVTKVYIGDAANISKVLRTQPTLASPAEETHLSKFTLRTQPSLARSSWGDTVTKVYTKDAAFIGRSSWGDTVIKVYTENAVPFCWNS